MVTKNKSLKSKKQPTNSKKPNNKTRFQNFIDFVKSHKLLMVVLVILLAVVIWYLTLQIIIVREKNQLNKAEASLELFTNDLQNDFGPNLVLDKYKSCGYRSTVYITIPNNPACGIGYTGQIPVTSATQATEYAEKIEIILDSNFEIDYRGDGYFQDFANSKPTEEYRYSFIMLDLSCGLNIDYFDPGDQSTPLQENHEIKISYSCTDLDSHKDFYTVLD
ncbi:MAG: hypothetical protein MUF85_03725 [Patescibacteria group bacterium]|jgi:hypothetical protein|nr:hypothetical protein [Patescibacteria group bacterium]